MSVRLMYLGRFPSTDCVLFLFFAFNFLILRFLFLSVHNRTQLFGNPELLEVG